MTAFDLTILEATGSTDGCKEDAINESKDPSWEGNGVRVLDIIGNVGKDVGEMWMSSWMIIVEVAEESVLTPAAVDG